MARQHGKDCRVYLGGRDLSGDVMSITPEATSDTHDTSVCGTAWKSFIGGLLSWSAAFEAFYDGAAGEIGRQTETLLGATGGILSIYDGDANALGDVGVLYSDAILESRQQPISATDMVKLSGTLRGTGRVGFNGILLHPLGQETITASTAAHNNSGSSANGGRGNLHVTAITGTWTIVIEHSSDSGAGDPWTTVCAFTQVAAAGGATGETVAIAGTIKQYTRVTATEDVAGSITFAAGIARY